MKIGGKSSQVIIHTLALLAAFGLVISIFRAARAVRATESAAVTRRLVLGKAQAGSLYAVTISVKDPAQIQGKQALHIIVADHQGEVAEKWLHSADLDFYLTL